MIYLNRKLEERNLPDVLVSDNGTVVDDAKMWDSRRNEIIQILSNEVYGFSPPAPPKVAQL